MLGMCFVRSEPQLAGERHASRKNSQHDTPEFVVVVNEAQERFEQCPGLAYAKQIFRCRIELLNKEIVIHQHNGCAEIVEDVVRCERRCNSAVRLRWVCWSWLAPQFTTFC